MLSADAPSQGDTARDEVDIAPAVEGLIGLPFRVTRHALLEDALVTEIVPAAQRPVDESSWPESGALLWRWASVTTHTVLFLIGPRSREMLENALQDGFFGLLISNG
ncbi:hypothetical protein [Accumulibacter sp.]|uniref:hypothetical protein n=1 Tax=Accumulibacter sp. TaxID=2053492 RepID=UPI0025D6FA8F|nr:hypothetical protein [Accumulibacter sp.]MCM8594498.1 hypothetical protein [Accumulibacter sp.]MCM8626763.1 hypothetical protein [Accumulibacter sp.]MDS4048644.1 hypothetical protein [Accumulibacter sp.]